MKTKYKILIISVMVLSIITCFAITSFAAYTTTDITYEDKQYQFNQYYSNNTFYVQLWGYNTINILKGNNVVNVYDSPYIILKVERDTDIDMSIYYVNNNVQTNYKYNDSGSTLNIIYTGDLKMGYLSAPTYNANLTNVYEESNPLKYDVWQNADLQEYGDGSTQINLLNNNEPNPLDKVNDFLTYLSTSLNKLTTMILANQILILFIVAVPVVSFVIGSFKRIKDSGRV